MSDRALEETAVFLVGVLKQLLYSFDRLDEIADCVADGSPMKAFYLNSIYNYVALLFLLDADRNRPVAGSVYPALKRHGLEGLLDPTLNLLATPLGDSSFGEVIRLFRNSAFVHPRYSQDDLKKIYEAADFGRPEVRAHWQDLLHHLRDTMQEFTIALVRSTGRPLEDFGIRPM